MDDILKIDIPSHVAAVSYEAARRVAELLTNYDGRFWVSGNIDVPEGEAEAAVQALAGYVCARPAPVHAEQLFIKARELDLHELADWSLQPDWVQGAYEVFAATAVSFKASLMAAQARAIDARRKAGPATETSPSAVNEASPAAAAADPAGAGEASPPPAPVTEQPLATTPRKRKS